MALSSRKMAITLSLCVISTAAFITTLRVTGPELSWDGHDYAQLARQMSRGEGETTKVLILSLSDRTKRKTGNLNAPWPSLFRPPFPAFLTSISFRLFGLSDTAAVVWSGAFYVATVMLMFLCFEPLYGTMVAFAAAVTFTLSNCGLLYARAGLTEPSAMFFLLAALLFLVKLPSRTSALLAGAALGMCSLSRPIAYLWVVVAVIYVLTRSAPKRDRARAAALILLGAAIPLLVAKASFDWKGGKELMGINLAYRVGDTEAAMEHPISFVLLHPKAMMSKFLHEIARPAVYLFQIGGLNLFSGLSVFGLFLVPTLPGPQRETRNIAILLFSATWIALAFLTEGDAFAGPLRYLDVFAPLLLPWGIAGLMLCATSKRQQYTLTGLIVLYWLGAGVQAIRDPFAQRNAGEVEIYRQLATIIPAQDVLAASMDLDVPGIAWYADRRAVIIQGNLEGGMAVLNRNGLYPTWYFGKDSDPAPTGFGKFKQWPGGLVLFHYSGNT